ncbi:MAG: hypothetical protein RJA26_455 [Actinomycetota bacterium]
MPARYPIMAVLVTALIVFLVIAAFRAWRSRADAQEAQFDAPLEWLEHPSGGRQWTGIQYVATSLLGQPLERVNAHGLGLRGFGKITVSRDGVLIERNGERAIGIPIENIKGVQRTTAAIDRGVEKDGLIQLDWVQNGFGLSTYLRATSSETRKQLFEELTQILGVENNKETKND